MIIYIHLLCFVACWADWRGPGLSRWSIEGYGGSANDQILNFAPLCCYKRKEGHGEGGRSQPRGKSRCRPPPPHQPGLALPLAALSPRPATHPGLEPRWRALALGGGAPRGTRLGPAGQGWETRGTSPLPDLGPEGPTSV